LSSELGDPLKTQTLNLKTHQDFDEWRGLVRYLGTPSTCVQFVPKGDRFAIDGDRQPGFRLLTLHEDGSYETQVIRLSD